MLKEVLLMFAMVSKIKILTESVFMFKLFCQISHHGHVGNM